MLTGVRDLTCDSAASIEGLAAEALSSLQVVKLPSHRRYEIIRCVHDSRGLEP